MLTNNDQEKKSNSREDDIKMWDEWIESILKYKDTPFMEERNQPEQQIREGLDDLFS